MAIDLDSSMGMQAELVYQIACAHLMNLSDPARKAEALTIFGLALGSGMTLKVGVGFRRFPEKIVPPRLYPSAPLRQAQGNALRVQSLVSSWLSGVEVSGRLFPGNHLTAQNIPVAGALVGAAGNAVMTYAVGFAAYQH